MKFYIETYGCTSNFGNSQDTADQLIKMGHSASSLDDADAVIVNTCAVTQKTERKIISRLRQLEGDRLIVAGCLCKALPKSLSKIKCKESLGLLHESASKTISGLFEDSICLENGFTSSSSNFHPCRKDLCGIINIAEGCNGCCSYCIVKRARGKLASRKLDEVVWAVQEKVRSGAVEIQLAAQDTAAYGQDIGIGLPELLRAVTDLPGNFMIRLGMMNPDSILPIQDELINVLRCEKIYKFLHVPVQSGSNRILRSMARKYLAEDFLELTYAFRSAFPDITLNTDVIVGFPGETDADFKETISLIKLIQPDKVNVTRFSRRSGTYAATLYDMPDRIKKERSRELTRLWMQIAEARNRRYVGQVLDARVTECGRGTTMKARSTNYVGIVVSSTPDLGSSCKIRVLESNPFYLGGIVQL